MQGREIRKEKGKVVVMGETNRLCGSGRGKGHHRDSGHGHRDCDGLPSAHGGLGDLVHRQAPGILTFPRFILVLFFFLFGLLRG